MKASSETSTGRLVVLEVDPRERIGPREAGALEVGQALAGRSREPEAGREGRPERTLDDSELWLCPLGPGPERREAEGERAPLGRAVEDLPVAKLPAAAEGHGAGADAAQGERDLRQGLARERALGADPEEVRRAIGNDLSGRRPKGLRGGVRAAAPRRAAARRRPTRAAEVETMNERRSIRLSLEAAPRRPASGGVARAGAG